MDNVSRIGTNVQIPVSDLRSRLTPLLVNSGAIVTRNGRYGFDHEVLGTVPGLDTSATYESQDFAIDAIFRAWFPHLFQRAA